MFAARPRRAVPAGAIAGGLAVATVGALLAGCSSSTGGGAGTQRPATAGSSTGPRSAATGAKVVTVSITAAHGCTADVGAFAAGGATFKVTNVDATAVSEVEVLSGERIIGEKENVPPGFSGQFAVAAPAGPYTLYCPGASPERTALRAAGTSTGGSADVAALLKTATVGYAKYIDTQVAALVTATNRLDAALHGTDLAAAQVAYIRARPFYEKIEPVAESFVVGKDSLDADIDARADNVPASQWRGFHRIEQGLFQRRSLAGLPSYGDKLVADVARLRTLSAGLTYQPTELANGAQSLLDEVAAHKITGEEERYSRIDLLDFADNAEAANQAFAQLQPALARIDPQLASTVAAQFTALGKLLDTYRTTTNASGYRLYPTLTAADKRSLSAAVKAVAEPLSTVTSKVANA